MVTISDLGLILGVSQTNTRGPRSNSLFLYSGDPLYVGFDLTIASFDSISEVSMVSILYQYANYINIYIHLEHTSYFRTILSQCI